MRQKLKTAAVLSAMILIIVGVVYVQFRIINDCGWMTLFKEWRWLFGYCTQ